MNKKLRKILYGSGKEIEKKSVFWNMLFSILNSLQSAVSLLIVTRINGTEDAGILSIAYAASYLMFTIGTYGVRNFQVTDSERYYGYEDYRKVRILSCCIMAASSVLYCLWRQYGYYKGAVVLMVCILKLLEAIEDLYHGELQRIGRLDIAGRSGVMRLIINYLTFLIVLCITQNLLLAVGVIALLSFLVVLWTKALCNGLFLKEKVKCDGKKLLKLIASCLPLFVTSFISIYICNAPKYAIDICLSEKEQAYYAILSMPVFTINLLSGVVYRPQLLAMAKLWNQDKQEMFRKMILKQVCHIMVIAMLILGFGITIGLKMLEILYNIPLVMLKTEFVVLLLGGGMVAVYNFLTACITIMRKQAFLIGLSIFMMLLACGISNILVSFAGLMGASWLYLILMSCEMLAVSIVLCFYLRKMKDKL